MAVHHGGVRLGIFGALGGSLGVGPVPTTFGHTLSNYLLRWVNASTVAVVGLLEAVGATLIAIPVFGQQPTWLVAVGGLLALGGAALFLIHRPRSDLPLPSAQTINSG